MFLAFLSVSRTKFTRAPSSGFAVPLDLDKRAFLGISNLQAAFEGIMQRFADCMRQVNVRCLNDDRIRLLFNPHDAVLGMLSILFPLTVSNQTKQFRYMTQRKVTVDSDYSRRVTIAGPMTGLTHLLVRVYRPGVCPLPAAFLEDGVANWAYSWLWRLAICFVRVMNVLVNQAVFPIGSRNIEFHGVFPCRRFWP